jgi:hypothetical protein
MSVLALSAAAERPCCYKLPGCVIFFESPPVTSRQKPRDGALRASVESLLAGGSAHVFDVRDEKRKLRRQ